MSEKEWWMPLKGESEYGGELNWLCDHMGDAQEVLDTMWQKLCEYDDTLPKDGFKSGYED
jgi:hypothetical protein